MPIDKFFTSAWKWKAGESQKQRARHRVQWPAGSQYKASEETVQLWMRESGTEMKWFHCRNVARTVARIEMEEWRANNPGWEFRLKQSET